MKKALLYLTLLAVVSAAVYHLTDQASNERYSSEIVSLQAELSAKDARIVELENKLSPPKPVSMKAVIQMPGVSPLDLQNALKRAHVYSGPFDGRLTTKVVDALKEFQRREGLVADGVLGKRTWRLLRDL